MVSNKSADDTAVAHLFECREFRQDAFRSMEVQICGETKTVQFAVEDNGGDHPTSPSVAISWDAATDLSEWVRSFTRPAKAVDVEAVKAVLIDPNDGSNALPLEYILIRGFSAMGWSQPSLAAHEICELVLALLRDGNAG